MQDPALLLASNSPRRRQLLALAGYSFIPASADIDETPLPGEPPDAYVLRLAREKAGYIYRTTAHELPVFAADTTVADGAQILGKPADAAEAVEMLRCLRGRAHRVYTGLALITPSGQVFTAGCATDVYMRAYTDAEIADYAASGDPLDKAGAYAIQHAGFHPVERLQGCYANVMGLPLCLAQRLLREAGIPLQVELVPCPENAETCSFCQTLAGDAYAGKTPAA